MTRVQFDPIRLPRLLAFIILFLALASAGGQVLKYAFGHDYVYGLVPFFFMDLEGNLPSFFSVLLILLPVPFLALLAALSNVSDRRFWVFLGFGFIYMAYDEAFSVHETLIAPFRHLLGEGRLGPFYFAWALPALLLVFLIGLVFFNFIYRLPPRSRRRFLLAALLYLAGALGMEMVGGAFAELHGMKNITYSLLATCEETLEMAGMVVFLHSLLSHLAAHHPQVVLHFGGPAHPLPPSKGDS